jgi:hypothetical protein
MTGAGVTRTGARARPAWTPTRSCSSPRVSPGRRCRSLPVRRASAGSVRSGSPAWNGRRPTVPPSGSGEGAPSRSVRCCGVRRRAGPGAGTGEQGGRRGRVYVTPAASERSRGAGPACRKTVRGSSCGRRSQPRARSRHTRACAGRREQTVTRSVPRRLGGRTRAAAPEGRGGGTPARPGPAQRPLARRRQLEDPGGQADETGTAPGSGTR